MVRVLKSYDIPSWKDKTRCPLCNSKLKKRYEGMVCRNNCPLSFKCNKGWAYIDKDSDWSLNRKKINIFYSQNERLRLDKKWVELKRDVLVRDNYACRKCNYKLSDDWYKCIGLDVHHIIPASEEMALYLDIDNCITLCKNCHKEIHKGDKHSFSSKDGN
jgi:hypothetical protein